MKIIFVNGFAIRNTLDLDFSTIHSHSVNIADYEPKWYIPKGEIWIDHVYRQEKDFLLKMDKLSRAYFQHHNGQKIIHASGRHVDMKHGYRAYLRQFCQKPPIPNFVERKGRTSGLTILFVDGRIVRSYIDPEFVVGGHEFVYSYIPKNQVWLDVRADKHELKYILLHEITERTLMANQGLHYDLAHEWANIEEKAWRCQNGIASYPGYDSYPWRELSNKEITKHYVRTAGQGKK